MGKSWQMTLFVLFTSLILTGCASSPSLEDQVKLVEYEKCLESFKNGLELEIALLATLSESYYKGTRRLSLEQRLTEMDYQKILESCKDLRP